ncbi:SDR family NAD(P)-dependent oxidoreductase [Streptomyces sp. NPDC102405]|uniref:SDR family NAD(P)-dependent oxidoreductase n=1 Tax=Streptomyces sp. NPDC102405 TaxID=3366170 RepID=UPI003807BA69
MTDSNGRPAGPSTAAAEDAQDVLLFPTSYAQQRMWFFYQLDPDSPLYTVPRVLRLTGDLDTAALEAALNHVVQRHEALRTTFTVVDEEPVQVIAPATPMRIPVLDVPAEEQPPAENPAERPEVQQAILRHIRQPFDLGTGPLLRVTLLRLAPSDHVLVICMHHIISDGWSLGIFARELNEAYRACTAGRPPAWDPLPAQYADFAEWQRDTLQGDALGKELAYWREQLAGELPHLSLPTDHPRPAVQSFRGARHGFTLPPELTKAVKEVGRRYGTTPFMTLLTAFSALLHRYTQQTDLIVGSPIAGRGLTQVEPLIGLFVNTLALRTDLSGDPTFATLLERVRDTCVGAYAHQDLPFEKLVEDLQPERDPGRNPLFQVMFALQNPPKEELDLPGVEVAALEYERWSARFDLEAHFWEYPDHFSGALVYNTDLFEPESIERLAGHLERLLRDAVADPACRLSELTLLSREEHDLLSAALPPTGYDPSAHLAERFALRAAHSASHPAITGPGELTYKALDERANRLANLLLGTGLRPGGPVGIHLAPGADAVTAVLAVLKAGGVCVPLDPADPPAVIRRHTAEAAAELLITQAAPATDTDPLCPGPVVALDEIATLLGQQASDAPEITTDGASPAFAVLSPSGRVLLSHAAIWHHVRWLQNTYPLDEQDVVAHQAASGLDQAVWEVVWPLLHGAAVLPVTAGGELAQWVRTLREGAASVAFLTASHLAHIAATMPGLPRLRLALSTGDPLDAQAVQRFEEAFPGRLHHLYGLPEACGFILAGDAYHQQPVGRPTHKSVQVLDPHGRLTPIGVMGEICVSGPGLAQAAPPVLHTGHRGRYLPDGQIQVIDAPPGQVRIDGHLIPTSEIEAVLTALQSVRECVVLARSTPAGLPELVAYVVPAAPFAEDRLRAALHDQLPAAWTPHAVVPVTGLPLTSAGALDTDALLRMPVADAELAARWEERLNADMSGPVAVLVREETEPSRRLHLHDVLPDNPAIPAPASHQPAALPPPAHKPAGDGKTVAAAISDGGPLPELDVQNLAEALHRAANVSAPGEVIHLDADGRETHQSYPELLHEAQCVLRGLRSRGLHPGDPVIFQFARNPEFLAAFWACVLGGFVPVPLAVPPTYEEANSGVNKLENAWHMLGRPRVLCGRGLGTALRALAASRGWDTFAADELAEVRTDTPDTQWHAASSEDLALMLLTSGSTGRPKAVMLNHRNILSRCAATARMNDFTAQDVSFNWMPLDHVGGIVMFHLRDVYLGARQIHAPTAAILQDPLRWTEWIDRYRVSVTWAPNFAYGLINDRAELLTDRGSGWDLSCLRFILNAGEAIVARVARRFLEVLAPFGLPATAMHPAWGMSETSSAVTYSDRFTLMTTRDDDSFVEVGRPVPGFSVRIVDGPGAVVDEGTIGRLQVRGRTLTAGYYDNAALNQEVFTTEGWFDTGDLGYLRDGALTITGRAKDTIIINGLNYYSHEIEAVVEELPIVQTSYTAACMVRSPASTTDQLAIFFHLAPGADEADAVRAIRTKVMREVGVNPDYLLPVTAQTIPKTEIGKIQRSKLGERFAAGDFTADLQRIDLLLANAHTLPDWFYRPLWRRQKLSPAPHTATDGPVLVLLDDLGLGLDIANRLRENGRPCVTVTPGAAFTRQGKDHFCLPPGSPDALDDLVAALANEGLQPAAVLHLLTYARSSTPAATAEEAADAQHATAGLLHLIHALDRHRTADRPVALHVIGSHTQQVDPSDTVACERTPLLGLIKSIGQEIPWLHSTHLDLTIEDTAHHTDRVLREMAALSAEPETAYRSGRRYVPRLTSLHHAERRPARLRRGGLYVISGGLGGLGLELAACLLDQYQARLLILGRSQQPDPAHHTLLTRDDVLYVPTDICAADQVRSAVATAEARWATSLSGVFHLAGAFLQQPLTDMTEQQLAEVLAPKMAGALNLHHVVKDRPGTLFVSFSSVNGYFGGAMVSAYAAANSFLDGLARHQRTACGLDSFSLAWSMWDEVGMSRDYPLKELTQARGYTSLGRQEGMQSLLVALQQDEPHVLIGLDAAKPWIRGHLDAPARPVHQLAAYHAAHPTTPDHPPTQPRLPDRYGTPSNCLLVPLEHLPTTPDGRIDRDRLPGLTGTPGQGADREQKANSAMEQMIAAVWRDVLNADRVGARDNFFDLGGSSLQMTQVHGRLGQELGRDVSMIDLFRYPTVGALADFLSDAAPADDQATNQGKDRAEKRKQRAARRSRPRRQAGPADS